MKKQGLHNKSVELWFYITIWFHPKWYHPKMVSPEANRPPPPPPPSDATANNFSQENDNKIFIARNTANRVKKTNYMQKSRLEAVFL